LHQLVLRGQELLHLWVVVVGLCIVGRIIAVVWSGLAGVGIVSGALLASADFVWTGATPSVGCCCWPVYCWPDGCSGCSSCSPSKKCLEKSCINILELNPTPKLYAVILFIFI
jgi:hypothetical protein